MEVVIAGVVRQAKLQSNCHHQQTNTHLSMGWMPFLSPNKQCQTTLHFNAHFPRVPGLAGTRMSPFWILLELRVM